MTDFQIDTKKFYTEHLGKEIYHFESIVSTQTFLKELLLEKNAQPGTIVLADHQQKGKGTQGRSWFSLPKPQLLFSILFQPSFPLQKLPILNILSGILLTETLAELNVKTEIKWPNDVYIGLKKTAGILSELITQNKQPYIILGIGLNVEANIDDFPIELRTTSTALSLHAPVINRFVILKKFLIKLENALYSLSVEELISYTQEKFEKLWIYRDQPIQIEQNQKIYQGTAKQIDSNGALCLKTKSGFEKIVSGTVSVI